MEVAKEGTRRKLAKHARRLVKEHGAEVAASVLVSLVSSAAALLLERAQRKAFKQARKAARKHAKGKKARRREAALHGA
jgi:hypothetical protein